MASQLLSMEYGFLRDLSHLVEMSEHTAHIRLGALYKKDYKWGK